MKRKLPVALQLFSVRNELEKDFEGTIKKVKSFGYDGVELAGLYGRSAAEMRALLEENELEAVSAHVSIDEMLSDPDGVMQLYSDIGCKFIAVPHLDEKRRVGAPDYEKTVGEMRALAACAEKHGLVFMYHNHDFEFEKAGEKYALDVFLGAMPEVSLELDTCWAAVAGEPPAEYLKHYAERSPVVHLKDYSLVGKKPADIFCIMGSGGDARDKNGVFGFRACGYGMNDIEAILDAADETNAEWLVVEQDAPSAGKTALECAELSVKYLKTLI